MKKPNKQKKLTLPIVLAKGQFLLPLQPTNNRNAGNKLMMGAQPNGLLALLTKKDFKILNQQRIVGQVSLGYDFAWGINKRQPCEITFDGKKIRAFQGDSVAAALLASHQQLIGRSFKYHRPRGIMTAGVEEPNALVKLGKDHFSEVNARATMAEVYQGLKVSSQNRFPSLKWDLMSVISWVSGIFPAGFYYKTFKFPRRFWEPIYERMIRRLAGLGKAETKVDGDSYAQRHVHVDLAIVGGGLAGLQLALQLAPAIVAAGKKLLLVDEDWQLGGYLHQANVLINGIPAMQWVKQATEQLAQYPEQNIQILTRTTMTALYDHQFLTALEKVTDHLPNRPLHHLPRQRFWKIRAEQIVLATGSLERPLVFANNDRPGVMLAGAVAEYLKRYGVLLGRKIILFTNNDSVYEIGAMLRAVGAMVTIVDTRKPATSYEPRFAYAETLRGMGCRIMEHAGICHVMNHSFGNKNVKAVAIGRYRPTNDKTKGNHMGLELDDNIQPLVLPCDLIGMSGGFVPTVHLYSQGRGQLQYDDGLCAYLPKEIPQQVLVTGGVAGAINYSMVLDQTHATAQQLVKLLKLPALNSDNALTKKSLVENEKNLLPEPIFILSGKKPIGQGKEKYFADFQNDVTAADWALAIREGYDGAELMKRYTTTGMATDQGKTSNLNALTYLAHQLNLPINQVGVTTFRPPYSTQTFGAIAGHQVGQLFQQSRITSIHPEHLKHQVVFENVGDWKRPWYFLQLKETMSTAVQREVKAVRQSVGMLDASTLGKIDIQGRDALKLLNLVYCNAWDSLKIGQCRYGLMLNENGMVFDDGVTTRLGEDHYHMTTTTGGAGRVYAWLEEWLQTEYPEWQVYCTSVTEQWAVASINGPNARLLLSELTQQTISHQAFPHMTMQVMSVAGIKARVFRISFTGELAFEINVPARYGRHLWQSLTAVGKKYNLTPYGTEAMHVLRAEKGYIIVGQDTDGMVTPYDLGLGHMVSKTKPDFLGKRSLTRPDTSSPNRRQLVGLMPLDKNFVPREGGQVVATLKKRPPMDMVGYVTSAYYSPNLDRAFALGLIKNGRALMGQVLYLPRMDGKPMPLQVCDPVFFDNEQRRLLT